MTSQLTVDRSTTELLRNMGRFNLLEFNSRSQPVNNMSLKLLFRKCEIMDRTYELATFGAIIVSAKFTG
jgi:hypothetical protein